VRCPPGSRFVFRPMTSPLPTAGSRRRVLLFFVDGIGVGSSDAVENPLAS